MKIERRQISNVRLEKRAADAMPIISGLAAPFNKPSDEPIWGEFYEQIKPGAFSRALLDPKTKCVANVGHNDQMIPLAKFRGGGNGTLQLRETEAGLEFSFEPRNTETGRELVAAIERGDLDEMSFAFRTIKDNWNGTHNGLTLRILEDVDIFDIAFVNVGAYGDNTNCGARFGEMTEAEYRSLAAPHKTASKADRDRRLRILELTNKNTANNL